MITACCPADGGVTLLSSSGHMIGFIDVDGSKYEAEKLKVLIMRLIQECVDSAKNFTQIDWESVFYSCERQVTLID